MSEPLFEFGDIVITRKINDYMDRLEGFDGFVYTSLGRFIRGDWGLMCEEDVEEVNNKSIKNRGGMIQGAYIFKGRKIWIITNADWKTTTILFPEEY